MVVGLAAAGVSVIYVRLVGWADRNAPKGWKRVVLPVLVLGLLGVVSVAYPQLLGNGRDLSQQLFTGGIASLALILPLLILKPVATVMCLRSGAPGGLFTPTLTLGALLGAALGHAGALLWPGLPVGLSAVIGAGAVLAATTQGPISAAVLMMELTGLDRSLIAPLLLAIVVATVVSRSIEPRSVYDARLSDEQVQSRFKGSDPASPSPSPSPEGQRS